MHFASQLQQLEAQLDDAKQAAAFRDMILKLTENKEFKKVVREGFLEKECARFARESSDPAMTDRQRADALGMAQAAGHFKRFLQAKIALGDVSAGEIVELEEAIAAVRAGDDGEDDNDNDAE